MKAERAEAEGGEAVFTRFASTYINVVLGASGY